MATASAAAPVYRRILLKLSGEALMGEGTFGIDADVAARIAAEIHEVHDLGVEVAVVLGGGNIFRGLSAKAQKIDRVAADHMGMLATIINSIALQDSLEKRGVHTRVMSAIEMRAVAEPYIRRRAVRHLEKGRVILIAAGTGNPYFTTDSAAALRAMEVRAEVLMKATRVDGIYTADPRIDPAATKIERIGYLEVLDRQLKVMDTTAISLCMDNSMPIIIFNLNQRGNIKRVVLGDRIGSVVTA